MRRTPSPRPFRLSDAVVLIVATAVGLALIKFINEFNGGLFKRAESKVLFEGAWSDRMGAWWALAMIGFLLAALMATPWSLALLALRMRRPRPRWRRVWRQPGTLACLACSLMVVQYGIVLGGQAIVGRFAGLSWEEIDFEEDIPVMSGFLIFGCWTALWLGGAGRPEKSWLDRAGRAIGVLMILIVFMGGIVPHWLDAMTPKNVPPSLPQLIPSPPTGPREYPPLELPEAPPGDPPPASPPIAPETPPGPIPVPEEPPAGPLPAPDGPPPPVVPADPRENAGPREKAEPPRRQSGRGDE